QLTERIRRRPYAVVLLDEIEKAHPDVFNMLLQIMEEGRLTDSFGRHVDFRNTIMIMTSNIGADLIKGGGGFGFAKRDEQASFENIKTVLMKEIERYFRPEFINRLDEVIVFRPLTKKDLETIVVYETNKVVKRLREQGYEVVLDQPAKDFLIEKGYNPDFGARPLRRAIGQFIEDPLSEMLLAGDLKGKNRIEVTHKEGEENLFFSSSTVEAANEGKETAAKAGAGSS
ncbi:MAG: AAA family ATPase, partial [Planctomycetota bacterium]|nr:AAA family ATPase [Planctomycetota bacterium]